jgi:hypothetical protein
MQQPSETTTTPATTAPTATATTTETTAPPPAASAPATATGEPPPDRAEAASATDEARDRDHFARLVRAVRAFSLAWYGGDPVTLSVTLGDGRVITLPVPPSYARGLRRRPRRRQQCQEGEQGA